MPIGRIGTDFIVNTTATNSQFTPSVTALADGRFVATWQSNDTGDGDVGCIRGRVFNADGSPAGNDFIVNSTATSSQFAPSVTALADGRFVATWQSADTGDGDVGCIRGRVFNADGSPAGNDFIVNTTATDSQITPSVTALADGRFVATWESGDTGDGDSSCIRGRVFNADGSPAGNDFIVNTTATDFQIAPSVTALADGRFVATWESGDTGDGDSTCIRGRVFNADGSPAGNDFIVNSTATNFQTTPSVTALADGRFVVTWRSHDTGDGDGFCIRGRVFNANGSPAGNDFIVNTTATSNQFDPSVTALADGRFVVTWRSNDTGDGDSTCIRGRVFNVDGTSAGNDFIVNTTATNSQLTPSVTALPDGRFVATWESDDASDGSGSCIRAQIFDPTIFIGTIAEDTWKGGNFADRITGGASGDTLSGLAGNDLINGDAGNDVLDGGAGDDRMFGGTDHDILIGGAGVDLLFGGNGDDTYRVDNTGDRAVEAAGGGFDRVLSSIGYSLQAGQEIELLRTSNPAATTALNLVGNEFGQTLQGNAGNNTLNGKGGDDLMQGLGGDDTYLVDSSGDKLTETAGNGFDRVLSSVSYTLQGGREIEVLRTSDPAGISAINLVGNEFGQTLQGNAGDNILNGKGGDDVMQGLGGDDTYLVDSAGDLTVEAVGGGSDKVQAAVSYALQAGREIEVLRTVNSGAATAIDLTGNEFAQTIQGNAGDNVLDGKAGNDLLQGLGGNNTFVFADGYDMDRVAGYQPGTDQFDLTGVSGLDSYADVQALMSQAGAHVVINFGAGDVLRVLNTTIATLDANPGDFLV
jgi:Ca2+-binding RTX toxin-like protein